MKKISIVGQVVGKYTKAIYEDNKKTDKTRKYIQLLDKETDENKNVTASLTNIKISDETFAGLDIDSVIEINVKEFVAEDGKVYFTELDK